ncbi:ATP-dependent Clp protease adaptor ClpS [Candidatus Campbellbacteria bacterium]|nr:MAG: ATP-dependent Clp protease adaptor ClpS [Candidatus Campbellbacteria bacterium]
MIGTHSKTIIDTIRIARPVHAWRTVLFNCDCHTFDAVIEQIMKAINCSESTASQLANVADQLGSVTVFTGAKERCEAIANVLGAIRLKVDVTQ